MFLDLDNATESLPYPHVFLDRVTSATTAFPTFLALLNATQGNRYTPTVYPETRRKRILIRALRANGVECWQGQAGRNRV